MAGADTTNHRCGYCGQENSRFCYSVRSVYGEVFSIRRCLGCGAFFLTPRPSAEQLGRYYEQEYYGTGSGKFSPAVEKVLDFFRRRRTCLVERFVRSPGRILDVGCGNGRFLGYLIEKGWEGYGVELAGKAAERAASIAGIRFKIGTLEDGDFPEGYFDAVSLWHVFEHLPAPRETLRIIHSILKPGGFLFVSMPNIRSWQGRLFKGNWLHLDPPRHLVFFSPEDLRKNLAQAGFRLCRKTTFSLEQNVFGIQQSLLNCLCRRRELLFEFLKGNRSYTADYPVLLLRLQQIFAVVSAPFFAVLAGVESLFGAGGTMEMVFVRQEKEQGADEGGKQLC